MGRRRGEKKESKTRPSQTQKTTLQRPRPRGRMQGLEPVNIPGAPGHICKARRGVAENVPCDSSIRVSNDHITVSKCTASADALKSWEEMPAEGYLGVYCNRPEKSPTGRLCGGKRNTVLLPVHYSTGANRQIVHVGDPFLRVAKAPALVRSIGAVYYEVKIVRPVHGPERQTYGQVLARMRNDGEHFPRSLRVADLIEPADGVDETCTTRCLSLLGP